MSSPRTLAVLPNLRATVRKDGRLVLTEKFLTGMDSYVEYWDGPVVVLIEPDATESDNLDNIPVERRGLPFGIDVTPFDAPDLGSKLSGCAIAQGGISYRQNHLSALCNGIGVPFVYGTEYTLKTRLQIIRSEERNPLRRTRRNLWEWNQERQNRAAIQRAAGIQCNGTPTFDSFGPLNENALLYFDSRVREEMVIDDAALAQRRAHLERGGQLRLAFSGRLNFMKGADHLVSLAKKLKAKSIPFDMTICGGGVLEEQMKEAIKRDGLGDLVEMRGVLKFEEELMPYIKKDVDLFVCCHRQGDPSCTYLETFACGVPIVGYDNEAFTGLLNRVDAGRSVEMDDQDALTGLIGELANDRAALTTMSENAVQFAREHTFERTFRRRLEHLRELSERQSGRNAS